MWSDTGWWPRSSKPTGSTETAMSSRTRTVLTFLIVAGTAALSWAAILIGQQFATVQVEIGSAATEDFVADTSIELEDLAATGAARQAARDSVEPVYAHDQEIDALVLGGIQNFFEVLRSATVDPNARDLPEFTTSTTIPAPTTPTTATSVVPTTVSETAETPSPEAVEPNVGASPPVASTSTTVPPPAATAGATGRVYIDVDANGFFGQGTDHGLADVRVVAFDIRGARFEAVTFSDGRFTLGRMEPGPAVVFYDTNTIPDRLTGPENLMYQEVFLEDAREYRLVELPLRVEVNPKDNQIASLRANGSLLLDPSVSLLVDIATEDVLRRILGEEEWLLAIEREALLLATEALNTNGGILSEELRDIQIQYRSTPRFVPLPGSDTVVWQQVSRVVPEIATEFLAANKAVDVVATDLLREQSAEAVEAVLIRYEPGDVIVAEGETVTEEIREALSRGGLLSLAAPRYVALGALVVVIVGLLALYLYRFEPGVWGSLRRMALFGLLVALAALSARAVAVFAVSDPAVGFLIPAAAFGLMTAILFDSRIAVLIALAVGSMTAVATVDPAYTLHAGLSALVPISFVSAISARRDLRRAALYIVALGGGIAALITWFLPHDAGILRATAFALAGGAVSWLVGSSLLSVLEIVFDITTSLRLLDLTDRNHPALRLLEEKAIGSFNHSLMVGTLADRAARAVGANPLLARAGAYYHDLGKTEHPQFFIENQFGIQNPHDQMRPEQSAEVIRRHVVDGLELARKFRIPGDVAEAVATHHGDGIMHFFYNKAKEKYGADSVDREDYRHAGRKPQRKEMAIVMIADSVEGACRAVFQSEEPTPDRISHLVERVVSEKVTDGQLSASDLTLGDLTSAKRAMVEALVGHYHQRIPYPNFPDRDGD